MEDDIAENLRSENPEQFLILVRMHLSFIIDMNTDENDCPNDKSKPFKWGFSKKLKNNNESNKNNLGPNKVAEVFMLTEKNVEQLYQLIDILGDEKNVCQEGIFRRTGSLSRQQQLRKLLSTGGSLSTEAPDELLYSVHDMASVLKGILADTPEPLLLNQNYQAYCHLAASNFSDGKPIQNCENRLIDALRLLLLLLPALDRCLAKRLLLLLHQTSLLESSNRMSPSALSTMFSPHVMCPRRLSPESLHTDSQILAPILGFMIERAPVLFTTPPQLSADITAYLSRRQQRRLLSPNGEDLNESVSEHTAASTIFTFVDRQMSGITDSGSNINNGTKANTSSTTVTDTALAQLYAHIQALPESQNKRRLIKQFNRENGCGTPLQLQRAQKQKSICHSLKKHIFNKSLMNKTVKKSLMLQDQGFGYQSIVESPLQKSCATDPSNENASNETPVKLTRIDIRSPNKEKTSDLDDSMEKSNNEPPENMKSPEMTVTPVLIRKKLDTNVLLTSTPQIGNVFASADVGNCSTPIFNNSHVLRRGSMSPITKSTQKMPKAMQESIMTPRSRKPVIISCDHPSTLQLNKNQTLKNDASNTSHDSSDLTSSSSGSMRNDSDFVSTDESCPSSSYCIKYKPINSADSSINGLKPSTESDPDFTKKKRRILREHLSDDLEYNLNESDSELINKKLLEASDMEANCSSGKSSKDASLTDAFRHYLLCRSILTKSPVDLSFVSEPGDFVNEDVPNLSEDKISTSMLYFLNGNKIEEASSKEGDASTCSINKENISPGSKRNVDVQISENLYVKTENKRKKKRKSMKELNLFESIDGEDFSNCDQRSRLRETNL